MFQRIFEHQYNQHHKFTLISLEIVSKYFIFLEFIAFIACGFIFKIPKCPRHFKVHNTNGSSILT